MVAEAKKVGANRYRESYGRYYEEFSVVIFMNIDLEERLQKVIIPGLHC